MSSLPLNLTKDQLTAIADKIQTPFHIYDEKRIRENARAMNEAFKWIPGFKNYFAVKACPNPDIIKILKEEGFGADCSSLPELLMAESVGITGEDVMFTSNDTPASEFAEAVRLGAIINLDDIQHIKLLEESAGIPELRHEWQIGFLRNRLALHLTDVCFDKFLPLLGRSFHSI